MYNLEYFNFAKPDLGKELSDKAKYITKQISSLNSFYQIFVKQNPDQELSKIIAIAKQIRENFSNVIVISMGGATLNPRMLVEFAKKNDNSVNIVFLDNTDPVFFKEKITTLDLSKSCFIAISNSGNTLETNALVGVLLNEFQRHNITDFSGRSFFITNPNKGVLKDIATAIRGTLIAHPDGISGRYSGVSVVSYLLGLICDLDVPSYIEGFNSVIDDFITNQEHSKPLVAAASIYQSGKTIMANIGYLQRFETFLEWYSQIIAESLGKNGQGYTPVRGLGPNDQHSMLQLYLDGAKDKIFSLFHTETYHQNTTQFSVVDLAEFGDLAKRDLSMINDINLYATLETLKDTKSPVRLFKLQDMSCKTFGALAAHAMLETVTLGLLLGVNPFTQPAVELIKTKASQMLREFY